MPKQIFSTERREYMGDLDRISRLGTCDFPIRKTHLCMHLRTTYNLSFHRFVTRLEDYKIMQLTPKGYILTTKGMALVRMLNE